MTLRRLAVVSLYALAAPSLAYAQSRLCMDRDTIVFGDRPVGSSTAASMTVSSCGNAPFRFTEVRPHSATGPGFVVETTCATDAVLAPGASCTANIQFVPTTPGQQSGGLWLRNDTSTPARLVTFYGRGTGTDAGTSVLGFAPATVQAGTSTVGIAAPAVRVDLENRGAVPIVPSALVVNGPAAYDFWIGGDCAVGQPIAPGEACHVFFTFVPAATGLRLANLVVDAPQLASLAVLPIAGMGVATPAPPPMVDIVEFHHAGRDGYFLTADADEAAFLDGGGLGNAWTRTGRVLRGWPAGVDAPGAVDACRFFGTPDRGPDSHFYTVDADECAAVRSNPYWQYEGIAFRLVPLGTGGCPAGMKVVQRFYKSAPVVTGIRHRYVTSAEDVAAMTAAGWAQEGPVFCSR